MKAPCQFQNEMNTINMDALDCTMPLTQTLWKEREDKMTTDLAQRVLLASEFDPVSLCCGGDG